MQIWEALEIGGTSAFVASAIGIFCLRSFFGSYLSEKAKGLATKEDIGEITRIVESVKHDNQVSLAQVTEALRAQRSLRFLAAERRLEIHQKAYKLWGEMLDLIHLATSEQRQERREEHVRFWTENCLYLDDSVRKAFAAAMDSFYRHRDLLDGGQRGLVNIDEITKNFSTVVRLGDVIVSACNLPKIADEARVASTREVSAHDARDGS